MENRSGDDDQPNTLNVIPSDPIQYMLIHSHKAQVMYVKGYFVSEISWSFSSIQFHAYKEIYFSEWQYPRFVLIQ